MNDIGGDCLLDGFAGGGRNGLRGRAIFCVNWQNGETKAGQGGGQDASFHNHGLSIRCEPSLYIDQGKSEIDFYGKGYSGKNTTPLMDKKTGQVAQFIF